MKIKLSKLIEEFEMQCEMGESYLDKETGEIFFIGILFENFLNSVFIG